VVPRSRGGAAAWDNLVAACGECNSKKGNSVLKELRGMRLITQPVKPSFYSLQNGAKELMPSLVSLSKGDIVAREILTGGLNFFLVGDCRGMV